MEYPRKNVANNLATRVIEKNGGRPPYNDSKLFAFSAYMIQCNPKDSPIKLKIKADCFLAVKVMINKPIKWIGSSDRPAAWASIVTASSGKETNKPKTRRIDRIRTNK